MITVCMAAYNGSKYIEEQVISILEQLGENDELIISDDSSTDLTKSLLLRIADDRVKFISNRGVSGYTGNFENALNFASGDFIFLSDQDDIWLPGKVKEFLIALQHSDFVIGDAVVVDENLNVINDSYFESRSTSFGFINSLMRCRYLGCCYAFNRKVLLKALPFPSNHMLLPHDLWLALISEAYFSVSYLKKPLIKYRRHLNNVSDGGIKTANSFVTIIKIRLYSLLNIAKVFFK